MKNVEEQLQKYNYPIDKVRQDTSSYIREIDEFCLKNQFDGQKLFDELEA